MSTELKLKVCVQKEEGSLRLHLPNLRLVTIYGLRSKGGRLHIDRDSFQEAAKLESLALYNPGNRVTMQPDCFAGLTALASIELQKCGLTEVPSALTALDGSLTSLMLKNNDDLQLTDDGFTTLLGLRKLRCVNLQKSSFKSAFRDGEVAVARAGKAHLHYDPPLWSLRSMQNLVRLPRVFLLAHGHVPQVVV